MTAQVKFRNKKSFTGGMTLAVHPDYPWKYGSAWFRTEELRDEYKRIQLLKKAAKRLGWPHDTIEELNKFDKWRSEQKEILKLRQQRDAEEKAQRAKLREEFGLGKGTHLYNFAATMSKNGDIAGATRLIAGSARAKLTDADKVAIIKKMIEDRTPIQELMIKTSQLVGAKL